MGEPWGHAICQDAWNRTWTSGAGALLFRLNHGTLELLSGIGDNWPSFDLILLFMDIAAVSFTEQSCIHKCEQQWTSSL